jgi:regulator of protease activity HflC (stomatin/prohibitin superfamily)
MLTCNCAWDTADLPVQSCVTQDDYEIAISAVLTYRVKDARKMLIDVAGDEGVLSDSSRGVIREIVGNHSYADLCRPAIDKKMTTAVRARAWRWGVEVKEVQLSDLTTAKTYRILGDSPVLPLEEE